MTRVDIINMTMSTDSNAKPIIKSLIYSNNNKKKKTNIKWENE